MSRPHEERVAVVTGGASGIGRALARRLAAGGAAVAVLDVGDPTEVLADLAECDVKALALSVDLTDPDAVQAAADEIAKQLTFEQWRSVFAINVDDSCREGTCEITGTRSSATRSGRPGSHDDLRLSFSRRPTGARSLISH